MKERHIFKAYLQILILIIGIFAFSYILKENTGENKIIIVKATTINFKQIIKIFFKLIFNDKNLVSALEVSDLSAGSYTCIEGKDGSLCQEYPSSECNNKCKTECVPASRDKVPGCEIGTCYDTDTGICQERSPKGECELDGGKWFDDPVGNIAECRKGCCVVGENVAPLITARECSNIGEISGVATNFKPEIRDELSCFALGKSKVEGACVFDGPEKQCKFLSKENCLKNHGSFYEGVLCTHPDLKMPYQKQASARCVEDKDEIYWFDSAGNRENIYDANKAKSWNNGLVLTKEESCNLGNSLQNKKTCGNCNRFLGSTCGEKTSGEKLSDNSIDAVCKDLRCVDKNGNARQNGESWCEYQGDIGEDEGSGGLTRSVDTPGSRHFRATCIDGEVQVNSCADYRNEICIEERTKAESREEISSSACVTNLWQLCISYNTELKDGENRESSIENRNKKCIENPHCQLKSVNVDKGFKFDTCVPKYSPGFDLQRNAEGGELSCAYATQKCTVIYVKGIDGWKCKANCNCEDPEFTEQMNDLCMSLGDCGASANYIGDLTENYNVKKAPRVGEGYLDKIKEYSESVEGKYAVQNSSQYIKVLGGIDKLGEGAFKDPTPGELQIGGTITGLTGSALLYTANSQYLATTFPQLYTPGFTIPAISGVLAGAAIGFAVTALLIQFSGIGAGLDPAIVWSLIGAGTAAGAVIGASIVSASIAGALGTTTLPILGAVGWVPIIGWIILIVVVIIISVLAALGVGDTKKKVVEFQCLPWQPPLGGAKCEECGKDGYPCSPYSCQSLGQTCRLINQGTNDERCVDISPNDVSSPAIKQWNEVLSEGYKYEEISERGFKISNNENDECIYSYTNLIFGIELNEPGYCKYDLKSTNNFDEMSYDFGNRNIFLDKHSHLFMVPDLTSLGISGYDPNRKADFNLYIRCIDGNGNGKQSSEYVINFCAKPGEDTTPPIVTGREPMNEFVGFSATKINGGVYTNEPAECKWSMQEKDYAEMENNMMCENDLVDRSSVFGWGCKAEFPVNRDSIYIKCKDQPWFGENWQGEGSESIEKNESKRNEMSESYEFVVKKSSTPLNIDYVKPNNESLVFGVAPATVILEVKTSGGVNGKATCSLFNVLMKETFGTTHKQILDRIFSGEYEIPITCVDSAQNSASITARFSAELDSNEPMVTRTYKNLGNLVIVTNEDSQCTFSKSFANECGFEFSNGTLMSGDKKLHTSEFKGGNYYIKCKDKWGNVPGACSVIVSG